jgi:hypothetical protein
LSKLLFLFYFLIVKHKIKKESFTYNAKCANWVKLALCLTGHFFKSWKPYRISAASSSIDDSNLKSYGIPVLRLTDDIEPLSESTKFLNNNYGAILFSRFKTLQGFDAVNLTGLTFLCFVKPYGVLHLPILQDWSSLF